MSNFGNYAFNRSNNNTNNNPDDHQNVTQILGQFADELNALVEKYKPTMIKEFNSLNKNNEKWKENNNGESCRAFEEKMWALSAPSEVVKIINRLYVNRVVKDN